MERNQAVGGDQGSSRLSPPPTPSLLAAFFFTLLEIFKKAKEPVEIKDKVLLSPPQKDKGCRAWRF